MKIPLFVAAFSAFSAGAAAQPIQILAFDLDRSTPCGEGSYSFESGNVHEAAREAVLDPANFGPDGTVQRPTVLLPGVSVIEPWMLTGVDLVIVNAIQTPLSTCERLTLRDFVEQGGGLFVFSNLAATDSALVTGSSGSVGCGGGTMAFVDGHAVVSGPFGAVSGNLATVYHCRFADLGPHGEAILKSDAPVGAAFEIGLGRAVVVNDEEWAMNAADCPAAPAWGAKSESFFLNIVAWAAPEPGFAYEPIDLSCYADCDENCELNLFDFLCFQNAFNDGLDYADCDGDGVLTLFDFLCYVNAFNAGC